MRAAVLGDEQSGDLALHPCGDEDRTGFGQRLNPRGDVRGVAINLAGRIHHHRTGFQPDASDKLRFAGDRVLAVEFCERALDCERRAHGAFSVVLLRDRIAKQCHQPVAQLLGNMAAHLGHCRRGGIEIGSDQVAPFLGIKPRRNAGRTDEIAEHHCEVAALADGLGRERRSPRRRGRLCRSGRMRESFGWRLFRVRVTTQRSDGIEQLEPVPDCCDAKLLQGLVRQARKDRLVYLILAERRLVPFEAKAPQPTSEVHDDALKPPCAYHRSGEIACPGAR